MEPNIPLLGEAFPSMTVKTTHGPKTLPEDYQGKWFVLFSHPADFTPVCTTEFVAFEQKTEDFRSLNCELIGLSIDQVFSHIKWTDWIEENLKVTISYPIIADDQGKVAQQLGMISPAKGSNTVRAIFIVDPEGKVRTMFYYPQELGRNMDEILRAVRGMQIADSNGVAMPANWPENSLIGDRVIIPPAADVTSAKNRLKEYEGFDWWFCHKELKK